MIIVSCQKWYNCEDIDLALKTENKTLERCIEFRLLGVVMMIFSFDNHVTFKLVLYSHVHRTQHILVVLTLLTLHSALIQSSIDYCLTVWG